MDEQARAKVGNSDNGKFQILEELVQQYFQEMEKINLEINGQNEEIQKMKEKMNVQKDQLMKLNGITEKDIQEMSRVNAVFGSQNQEMSNLIQKSKNSPILSPENNILQDHEDKNVNSPMENTESRANIMFPKKMIFFVPPSPTSTLSVSETLNQKMELQKKNLLILREIISTQTHQLSEISQNFDILQHHLSKVTTNAEIHQKQISEIFLPLTAQKTQISLFSQILNTHTEQIEEFEKTVKKHVMQIERCSEDRAELVHKQQGEAEKWSKRVEGEERKVTALTQEKVGLTQVVEDLKKQLEQGSQRRWGFF